MPCLYETPWGLWGNPEKTTAWSEDKPQVSFSTAYISSAC